jgi:Cys-rich repeat protein
VGSGFKPSQFSWRAAKIEKKISIKLQKDSTNRFQSCYAVETGTNQDLVKNFCNNLGSSDGNAATVDSIFEWDPATNSCKLKDLRCPIGQIYSGFDSTGVRRCHTIQQWSNLGNFIDTAASATCAPANAPNVRFVFTTGARMRVDCGASATPPPPPTCTSNAQCPTGQYCNAALGCQPITGCTTPWGATLNIGDTVTAYQSSSPVCPSTCVSQTRTCTVSGTLSGSYTQQSCTNPTCSTLPVCCPFNGLMMPDCMSCPPLPYGAPNMCTTISLQCY